jgi:hypothetical protein
MLCLLLVGRKRKNKIKKERKRAMGLFPRARHTLQAVLHGIFVADRCN